MKTELATFCRDYEKVLTPFIEKVRDSIRVIGEGPGADLLHVPLAGLNDVGQRLRTLTEKIRGQQAYLLIFGPLKSGKSTLMNAISQEYVSEVSALPAYPCLVYVRDGKKPHFSATRYNGRLTEYQDTNALQEVIAQCHTALSDRICQKESEGAEFDPQVDYAEAIRRVDIELPIPNLKESSTVLVDTPGLYSRMKFGYDLMTREFRNTAACAIFVVKADNLYLEQVFDEFTDLLRLFSRVFLVVNLDSSKKDLAPDGTLRPSIEKEDPARIIKAFETLAMNANLREALESGRLNIYAIDLLGAAANLLSKTEEPETEAPSESFQKFTSDLTEYLNSNEYFISFMKDSLTQGSVFCDEIRGHLNDETLAPFHQRVTRLQQELDDLKTKCRAAAELLNASNEGVFQRVQQSNEQSATELGSSIRDEVKEALSNDIDDWRQSNESLQELGWKRWSETLNQFANKIANEAVDRVSSLVKTPMGGADFSDSAVRLLGTLEFLPSEIGGEALESLRKKPERPTCAVRIQDEEIPVRKTFIDWLLFRSRATIRKRLFGEPNALDKPISPEDKQKRLTEESHKAINEIANRYVHAEFQNVPRNCARRTMGRYTAEFTKLLTERLDRIKRDLDREIERKQTDIASARRIVNAIAELDENMNSLGRSIHFLRNEHMPFAESVSENDGSSEATSLANDWRLLWDAPRTEPLRFVASPNGAATSNTAQDDWRLFWGQPQKSAPIRLKPTPSAANDWRLFWK